MCSITTDAEKGGGNSGESWWWPVQWLTRTLVCGMDREELTKAVSMMAYPLEEHGVCVMSSQMSPFVGYELCTTVPRVVP